MYTQSEIMNLKSNGLTNDSLVNGIIINGVGSGERGKIGGGKEGGKINGVVGADGGGGGVERLHNFYIIDPESIAKNWLTKQYDVIDVLLANDNKLINKLCISIKFGKKIIINETDKIEPAIYPILRNDYYIQSGGRKTVIIGESTIDVSENFELYICTKNINNWINLYAYSKLLLTCINFSYSHIGLEEYFLSIIIHSKNPDLEKKQKKLYYEENELKKKLYIVEEELLNQLANSDGNILENEPLLQSLDSAKKSSKKINEALKESNILSDVLDNEKEKYKNISIIGLSLYKVVSDLILLNNIYNFSLNYFSKLFKIGLNNDNIYILIFYNISKSLYEKDKLIFALNLCRNLNLILDNEWELLEIQINNIVTVITDNNITVSDCIPSWIPESRISHFNLLNEKFPNLIKKCSFEDNSIWSKWIKIEYSEKEFPVVNEDEKISNFEKILIISTLRPDRLYMALTMFVCSSLGVSSLTPPAVSLKSLIDDEMTNIEPAMYIITPGTDPTHDIDILSKVYKKTDGQAVKVHSLPMGPQSQNDEAVRVISSAAETGDWVILKNLHLVTNWLPTLEKTLKTVSATKANDQFRCFLTSEPHLKLAPSLLELSLKICTEPPPGVKRNLMRILEKSSDTILFSEKDNKIKNKIIYLCCLLHSILQERRYYIPQGYSKFYDFSLADLNIACETVDMILNSNSNLDIESSNSNNNLDIETSNSNINLDIESFKGILDICIYGSCIDNIYDKRIIDIYINIIFNDNIINNNRKFNNIINIPYISNMKSTKLYDFINITNNMNDFETPGGSFGLPPNADQGRNRCLCEDIIKGIKIMSNDTLVEEKTNDKKINKTLIGENRQNIEKLLNKYKELIKIIKSKKYILKYICNNDPIVSYLYMDKKSTSELVDLICSTFEHMEKVFDGFETASNWVQISINFLIKNEIPQTWEDIWPSGPNDPTVFIQSLSNKVTSGITDVQLIVSSNISFTSFLKPDAFLNSLRQQTARTINKPLDSLSLYVSLSKTTFFKNSKLPIITVQGLYINGCSLDISSGLLVDTFTDSLELEPLPNLYLAWDEEEEEYLKNCHISVPVYSSSKRDYFICQLTFPTENPEIRILNSPAIIVSN
eukprot:GHVL01037266.1.p1 GENE.GHVL01037266.1~~GHVL01037266.1.p1  ORF type:complete len:1161 (+),score=372.22 GHVL01037266.1:139-3483(+)